MSHKSKSTPAGFHISGFEKITVSILALSVAGVYLAAGLNVVSVNDHSAAVPTATKQDSNHLVYVDLPRVQLFGLPESNLADQAKAFSGPIKVASAADLQDKFSVAGFSLSDIRDGGEVPRVALVNLPADLSLLTSVKDRKSLFIRSMLPLVLQANEKVRMDRLRLLKLMVRVGQPGETNRLWLLKLAKRYAVKGDDLKQIMTELKIRVDIVPPSLALAQGAEESGWGTSRFAVQGNAVFGQWTYTKGKGIVPENRNEGASHEVRAFDELGGSIEAYIFNLNTHSAYTKFRNRRAALRKSALDVTGAEMIKTLDRYSERGAAYIGTIRTIMRVNELSAFDRARLRVAGGEET